MPRVEARHGVDGEVRGVGNAVVLVDMDQVRDRRGHVARTNAQVGLGNGDGAKGPRPRATGDAGHASFDVDEVGIPQSVP